MTPRLRREKIVHLLRQSERVNVSRLAELLQSSRETIRRDLTELDAKGLLKKVHGGAVSVDLAQQDDLSEGPFQVRMQENAKAKRALARAAARLLKAGDTVFVDTGTTTIFLGEEIGRREGVTVITNSGLIASQVAKGRGNKVFLLGGEYRDEGAENVGPLTIDQVGRFHASHSIITVGAVSESGFLDYDLQETDIAKAMISQSARLIVLADSSKFGKNALFQVGPLSIADWVVTDRLPPPPFNDLLAASKVEVIASECSD